MIKIKHKDQIREVPEFETIEIEDLDLGFQVIPQNVEVVLKGKSILKAAKISKVTALDESILDIEGGEVILKDSAYGIIRHNAKCFQYDYSRADYYWRTQGNLTDHSLGIFHSSSFGYLSSCSKGIFFGRSRGSLYENSKGRFYDSSFGLLLENSEGRFYNWSTGEIASRGAKAYSYGDSKIIKKVPYTVKSLSEWIKWNNAEHFEKDGKTYIFLYKWVDKNYRDFHTGTIDYSKEKIEAPDWDPDYKDECGRGLHLAFDPWTAFHFNPSEEGRMLKFRVPAQYIRVYTGIDCYGPYKARVQKLSKYIAEFKLEKNEWIEVKGDPK